MQYQKSREILRLYLPEMAWGLFMLGLLFSLLPHVGGSYEEMGDIALIARQNALASDFDVLRGAYSRLGFFHPGPISFYWMALVDWLLPNSWFAEYSHYYPYCMAIWLANALMGLGALGAARRVGLSLLNRLLLLSLIVFFLWHLGGHLFFSPWGPHLTILPMLWFCLNLIRAGEGDFSALPGLAFASIWILHSHAGSLIFLGPSLLYLLFLWYRLSRERPLNRASIQIPFLLGMAILLLGLSLPIYEALTNEGGNIAAILHYLGENSTWRKPGKALVFMLSTMDGPVATLVPLFFPASLIALYWARQILQKSEKRLLLACSIVMLGSFYGALRTPGVLVPHLFDHLLTIQALFVSIVWTPLLGRSGHFLSSRISQRQRFMQEAPWLPLAGLAILLFSLLLGWVREAGPPRDVFRPSELLVRLKSIGLPGPQAGTVRIHWDREDLVYWPRAAGLMLQMERRGYSVCIERPYDVLFGPESLCQGPTKETILIEPASKNPKIEHAGSESVRYLEIRATLRNDSQQ